MKRKLSKKLLSLSLVFCMAGVPQSAAAQADEYVFTDAGDTAAHDLFTAGTTGADEIIGVGKAAETEAASSFKAPGEEVLGDGNLPFIRTAEIPSGDEGVPYTFQFEADGNGNKISWSLADGSELPEGMSLSGEGVLSGTPKEIGAYALFVQAEAGGRQSMKIFHFYINAKEEVVPDYRVTLRVDMETDFGIIEAGTTAEKSIIFENSGRKPVNFEKLPESRYFDLTVDSESEGEIAPSLGYLVKAKTKEGLKPGKYEETITVKTIEGAECTITLKVILGPASEKPYDLLCTPSDIKFTEDDFYDPEFRVEAVMKVTNAGQKNTKVTVDTSEFIHFMIDDQPAYDYEFERQDTTIALKPGQSFTYYAIPKQSYGTYEERVFM